MRKIKTARGKTIITRWHGNEQTRLNMTQKAEAYYHGMDPLDIYEQEIWIDDENDEIQGGHNEYHYYLRGILEYDDLTEDEVNSLLEECADEEAAIDEEQD